MLNKRLLVLSDMGTHSTTELYWTTLYIAIQEGVGH